MNKKPNPIGNKERRTCGYKQRHSTEEVAKREAKSAGKKFRVKFHCYLCPFCHYWHIAKNPWKPKNER